MRKGHFFKHVLLGLIAVAGFGATVMLLWNCLIPGIVGWSAINFWQAIGLLALARILFGGMSGRHWMDGGMRHHHFNPVREKWEKMTPDEQKEFVRKREEFIKNSWKRGFHRHGFGHDFDAGFFRPDEHEKQQQCGENTETE